MEQTSVVKVFRILPPFLKATALILNGAFIPFCLFAGFIWLAADVGANEAFSRLGWSILLAVASLVVVAALLLSDRHRPFVRAGHAAAVVLLVASLWEWYEHFNLFSDVFPPEDALIFGGLALLNTATLIANRPLRLAPLLERRSARYSLIGSIVVAGLVAVLVATTFAGRISNQYPYAKHVLQLGGGIRWQNGWVVGVYLKATPTTDDDLRHLKHFPRLESLYLSDTPITDAGLAHISQLRSLDSLYLDNTAVTDHGLRHISSLTRLRNFWMHGTQVTDNGLVHLEEMTEMGYLDLGNTGVTDAGLPHLYGMKELYYLHLPGTGVTDAGLRRITAEIRGLSAYNGRTQVHRRLP